MSWFADTIYKYEVGTSLLTEEDKKNPFTNLVVDEEFEEVIISLKEEEVNGETTDPTDVSSG